MAPTSNIISSPTHGEPSFTMNKSFFRRVADEMLDNETARQIAEQEDAIAQNPDWSEGYYHLAQLLRVQQKPLEAKRQLLIALEKKPVLTDAHIALGELLIAEGEFDRAREHAEIAAQLGNRRLLEQMERNNHR
jgi:tetratricopeptide (TPR) repeat protein